MKIGAGELETHSPVSSSMIRSAFQVSFPLRNSEKENCRHCFTLGGAVRSAAVKSRPSRSPGV